MWKWFFAIIYRILFSTLDTHQLLTVLIRSFAHGSGEKADWLHPEDGSLKQKAAVSHFSLPLLGFQGHPCPGQDFPHFPAHSWSHSCPQTTLCLWFGDPFPVGASVTSCSPAPWLDLVLPCRDAMLFLPSIPIFLLLLTLQRSLGKGIRPVLLHSCRSKNHR